MFSRIKTLHLIGLLFPNVVLMTLGLTALSYALIDFFPIQTFEAFQDIQAQIISQLWQSLVWVAHSISLSFLIYYHLGKRKGLTQGSLACFIAQNFGEYITAQLRVLIRVSLWFLALILPGIIMDARYRLTSLFVFFHPRFHEDRTLDPLRLSLEAIPLTKLGFITLMVILCYVLPMGIDSFYPHASFMFEPTGRFVQIALFSILNLITHTYIFKTYLDVTEGKYV